MKEKIMRLFTNKIFIISSLIVLLLGAIAGVTFAWVGRTNEAELDATVAKILVDSEFAQDITEEELDGIMPGDVISGPISVQLNEQSRSAYIRFKLSLEIDKTKKDSEGNDFRLSSDQEKWLKEINFNLCDTYSEAATSPQDLGYRWSPYRGGYYYLLNNDTSLGVGVEKMLKVENLTEKETPEPNRIYKLTDGVKIDFDSSMVFTTEYDEKIPFILKIEVQAIQADYLQTDIRVSNTVQTVKIENAGNNNRLLIGQLMNDVIGESVQECYIINFDSKGGTTVRSITVPFLDTSKSTIYPDQYELKDGKYKTLTNIIMPQNPTRVNHAFVGWYYDKKEGNTTVQTKFTATTEIYSDMDVYAKWEEGVPLRFRFARGEESHGVTLVGDSYVAKGKTYTLPTYVYNGMELVWFRDFNISSSSLTGTKPFMAGGEETEAIQVDTTFYGAWYYIGNAFEVKVEGRKQVATVTECEYWDVYEGYNQIYKIPVSVTVDNGDVLTRLVNSATQTNPATVYFYSIDIYKNFQADIASIEEVEDGYKLKFKNIQEVVTEEGTEKLASVKTKLVESVKPFTGDQPAFLYDDDNAEVEGVYFSQSRQPAVNDRVYIKTDFTYKVGANGESKISDVTYVDENGVKSDYIFEREYTLLPTIPSDFAQDKDIDVILSRNYRGEISLVAKLREEIEYKGQNFEVLFDYSTNSDGTFKLDYNLPVNTAIASQGYKNFSYDGVFTSTKFVSSTDNAFIIDSGVITSYSNNFPSILLTDSATGIGEGAFLNSKSLQRLIIPNGYTSFGKSAFEGCSNLETLVMGDNISQISEKLFKGCVKLKSITIPEGVQSIGVSAFEDCVGVEEVYYNSTHAIDFTEGNNIFKSLGVASSGVEVYLGDKAVHIPNYFMYPIAVPADFDNFDEALSSLSYSVNELPNIINVYGMCSLKTIGEKAFLLNPNLKNLYIKSSTNVANKVSQLETIMPYAFYGCVNLESANIPSGSNVKNGDNQPTPTKITIHDGAFARTESLRNVDFGESIQRIERMAYRDSAITSIMLPTGVVFVGEAAFKNCINVSNVSIGESLEQVGLEAFYGLKNCSYVFVNADMQWVEGVRGTVNGQVGFFKDFGKNLIDKEVALVFGSDVTSISSYFLYLNDTRVTTITIGDNVLYIGDNAFNACRQLSELIVNSEVLSRIGVSAFYNCDKLKEVVIPKTVSEIGEDAFRNCDDLEKITYNAVSCIDFGTKLSNKNVFARAGAESNKLEVVIGEEVSRLPANLFSASNINDAPLIHKIYYNAIDATATNATKDSNIFSLIKTNAIDTNNQRVVITPEIIIGNLVKKVPAYLFYSGIYAKVSFAGNSYVYNDVKHDDEIQEEERSLYEKISIKISKLRIGDLVNEIGAYAFYGLEASDVYFGISIRTIGHYSFYGCQNLNDLSLKDGVSTIGGYAFYNSRNVKQLTIGESVESIGPYAFAHMDLLQRIYFNAVKCDSSANANIFEYAGSSSAAGTSLVFGNRVQRVPQYLINSNTTRIVVVQISNSVIRIGTRAFAECSNLRNVKIGSGVQIIEDEAFSNCGMTAAVIPASVISIGKQAFFNCFNLSLIEFNAINCADFTESNFIFERRVSESTTGYTAATLVIGSSVERLPANFIEYTEVLDGTGRVYSAYVNKVVINSVNLEATIASKSPLEGIGKDISSGATVTFSDSVVRVPAKLFENANITSLYLGRSVISVGNSAFNNCQSLKTVTFSQTITTFGDSCFNMCTEMRNTNDFPAYVTSVGIRAFAGCENLSIELDLTTLKVVRSYSFYGAGVTRLIVGAGVESIEEGAFADCRILEYIEFNATRCTYPIMTVDEEITTDEDLDGDGELDKIIRKVKIDPEIFVCNTTEVNRELYVTDGVTFLPDFFMANVKNLSYVYFNPKNLLAVGEFSFAGSGSFAESLNIEFGINVTRIPDNMFAGTENQTSGVTSVNMTEKITVIGNRAFAYCVRLIEAPLTTSIREILDYAFDHCTSLRRINIPNSVTTLGEGAFSHCIAAESITLGTGLKAIGDRAFEYCLNVYLTSVNTETLPEFKPDSHVFKCLGQNLGYGNGGTLNIGSNVLQIPEYFMSGYTGEFSYTSCYGHEPCTSPSINPAPHGKDAEGNPIPCCDYHTGAVGCGAAQAIAPNIKNINIDNGPSLISGFAFACNPYIDKVIVPGTVTTVVPSAFFHVSGDIERTEEVILKGKLRYADGSDYNGGQAVIVTFETFYALFSSTGGAVETSGTDIADRGGTAVFATSFDLYASPVLDANGYISINVYREGNVTGAKTIPKQISYIIDSSMISTAETVEVAFNIVGVGDYAFFDTQATRYSLPEGVQTIGNHAFRSCDELTAISLPTSVETIGTSAFDSCVELVSLYIPEKVKSIGVSAFANLSKVNTVEIDSDLIPDFNKKSLIFTGLGTDCEGAAVIFRPRVTKIPKYIFYSSAVGGIKLSSISFEGNVTKIGEGAFANTTGLTKIVIPGYTTEIEASAFEQIATLKNMYYASEEAASQESSLRTIGEKAFAGCGLIDITIFQTVEIIEKEAFRDNKSAINISLPNSIGALGKNAFANCENAKTLLYNTNKITAYGDGLSPFTDLSKALPFDGSGCAVTFGSEVTAIPEGLFRNSKANLASITFPGSCTSIGAYAFATVRGLTSLTIAGGVTEIKQEAFADCYELVNLDLGFNVTTIEVNVFKNSKVEILTLPASLVNIAENAFALMKHVKQINYNIVNLTTNYNINPDTATNEYYSFFDTSLGENVEDGVTLVVGKDVVSIPAKFLFNIEKCEFIDFNDYETGVDEVYNKLERIGELAFYNTRVTSIILPTNLKTIGMGAFADITTLESIYVNSSNLTGFTSQTMAFSDTLEGGVAFTVEFNSGVTSVPEYMFFNATRLSQLVLSDTINSIGSCAFTNCKIEVLTIPENVVRIDPLAFALNGIIDLKFNATSISNFASPYYNVFYQSISSANVTIGDNVTTIPDYFIAQAHIDGLEDIAQTIGVENYVSQIISGSISTDGLALDPYELGVLTIGSSVSSIGSLAFAEATNISEIHYNAVNVSNLALEDAPFRNLYAYELVIADTVSSIPSYLFYAPLPDAENTYTITVTKVTIGSGVSSIGAGAFTRMVGVEKLTYKAQQLSEYSFSESPFVGFGALNTKVIIENTVKSVPSNFMNGASVSSVIFNYLHDLSHPETVDPTLETNIESIGDNAFANNTTLTEAVFSSAPVPTHIGTTVFGANEEFAIYVPMCTQPPIEYPPEEEETPPEGGEGTEGGDGTDTGDGTGTDTGDGTGTGDDLETDTGDGTGDDLETDTGDGTGTDTGDGTGTGDDLETDTGDGTGEDPEPVQPEGPYEIAFSGYVVEYYACDNFSNFLPE